MKKVQTKLLALLLAAILGASACTSATALDCEDEGTCCTEESGCRHTMGSS